VIIAGAVEGEWSQPFDSLMFLVILSITLSTLLVVCLVIIIVLGLCLRTRTKTGDVSASCYEVCNPHFGGRPMQQKPLLVEYLHVELFIHPARMDAMPNVVAFLSFFFFHDVYR